MFSFQGKFNVVKFRLQGISVLNIKLMFLYIVTFELKKITQLTHFTVKWLLKYTENN